jgi:hypothetical protein
MVFEFREDYTVKQAKALEEALGAFAKSTFATEAWLLSMAVVDQAGQKEPLFEGKTHGLKVVMAILSYARRALSHLASGYEHLDLSLTGWAGRSLVELRIWNRYVWASRENMRRFHDESIVDKREMHMLVLSTLNADNSKPEAIEEVEEGLRGIEAELDTSTITPGQKRLQVKLICKEVGLEQFYKTYFGLLSKVAHPTPGLLIEVETGKEEISVEALQPIFVLGMQSAGEILNTAIEGLGMRDGAEQWIKFHEDKG